MYKNSQFATATKKHQKYSNNMESLNLQELDGSITGRAYSPGGLHNRNIFSVYRAYNRRDV